MLEAPSGKPFTEEVSSQRVHRLHRVRSRRSALAACQILFRALEYLWQSMHRLPDDSSAARYRPMVFSNRMYKFLGLLQSYQTQHPVMAQLQGSETLGSFMCHASIYAQIANQPADRERRVLQQSMQGCSYISHVISKVNEPQHRDRNKSQH